MAAKCKICKKSVYPMDPQINLDGSLFHKPCAKCSDCNCQITLSNFVKHETGDETILLCKTHYFKRFHEGGTLQNEFPFSFNCFFYYFITGLSPHTYRDKKFMNRRVDVGLKFY